MAYRKRTATKRRRSPVRRRRMGAASRSSRKLKVAKIAGLIVGAVAPQFLSGMNIGGKVLDAKIVGIGSAAIGFLLPRFVKGEFFEGVGSGMIASGGVITLKEFNVLNGIPIIAGWQDMKIINGPGASPTMSKGNALRDNGQSSPFRPSASQMMNGYYRNSYRD